MWKKLGTLALMAALVTACGDATSDEGDGAGSPASPSGDGGAYYFQSVLADRADTPPGMPPGPATLASMLPCGAEQHRLVSSTVVSGTVKDVVPGDAYVWGDEAEVPELLPSFDDARADQRDVLLTIDAASVITADGSETSPDPVQVRVSVYGDADPEQFIESLSDVGEGVFFLSTRTAAPHAGDLFPSLGGALIGQVDGDAISFPGLDQDPAAFLGELDTADKVMASCG